MSIKKRMKVSNIIHNKMIAKLKEEEEERLKRQKFKKPLPLESKKDHIKLIFSTLNFKPKPTCYTEDFGT